MIPASGGNGGGRSGDSSVESKEIPSQAVKFFSFSKLFFFTQFYRSGVLLRTGLILIGIAGVPLGTKDNAIYSIDRECIKILSQKCALLF